MLGLDVSFSALRVTPEWCAARRAEGYELFVGDLWTGNRPVPGIEQAMRTWREAGGKIAGYFCAHDATPLETHFQAAKKSAGAEWNNLRFVAVDVEIDPASEQGVLAACQRVVDEGKRVVLYTARWFWVGRMGDPQSCATYPLWDAHYGVHPTLEAPGYGGWSGKVGHQYQDTTDLEGVDVDINVFDDNFVNGVNENVPIQVPEVSDAEVQQLHLRWADAQAVHQTADGLHQLAAAMEANIIQRKIQLGLQ
jgi:hypothetical protein